MIMRTWNNKLFLGSMPGRNKRGRPAGDFDQWLNEMGDRDIRAVVCLAPDEQIAEESPRYHSWREKQKRLGADADFELIDIPIADYGVPADSVKERFWDKAGEVAERAKAGEVFFVHCGAGIGRTGMFSTAVLMEMGYDYEDALTEVQAVGSAPETEAQRAFLRERDGRGEKHA
jgi:protein-tyrosine phosphatase